VVFVACKSPENAEKCKIHFSLQVFSEAHSGLNERWINEKGFVKCRKIIRWDLCASEKIPEMELSRIWQGLGLKSRL
jgi:hypothetical protein